MLARAHATRPHLHIFVSATHRDGMPNGVSACLSRPLLCGLSVALLAGAVPVGEG